MKYSVLHFPTSNSSTPYSLSDNNQSSPSPDSPSTLVNPFQEPFIFSFEESLTTPFPSYNDCPKLSPTAVLTKAKLAKPYFNQSGGRNYINQDLAVWKYSIIEETRFLIYDSKDLSGRKSQQVENLENGLMGNSEIEVVLSDGRILRWDMPKRCKLKLCSALKQLQVAEEARTVKSSLNELQSKHSSTIDRPAGPYTSVNALEALPSKLNESTEYSSDEKADCSRESSSSTLQLESNANNIQQSRFNLSLNTDARNRLKTEVVNLFSRFVFEVIGKALPRTFNQWLAETKMQEIQRDLLVLIKSVDDQKKYLDSFSTKLNHLHLKFISAIANTSTTDTLSENKQLIYGAVRIWKSMRPQYDILLLKSSIEPSFPRELCYFSDTFLSLVSSIISQELSNCTPTLQHMHETIKTAKDKLNFELGQRKDKKGSRNSILSTFKHFSRLLLTSNSSDTEDNFESDEEADEIARLNSRMFEEYYVHMMVKAEKAFDYFQELSARKTSLDAEFAKSIQLLKKEQETSTQTRVHAGIGTKNDNPEGSPYSSPSQKTKSSPKPLQSKPQPQNPSTPRNRRMKVGASPSTPKKTGSAVTGEQKFSKVGDDNSSIVVGAFKVEERNSTEVDFSPIKIEVDVDGSGVVAQAAEVSKLSLIAAQEVTAIEAEIKQQVIAEINSQVEFSDTSSQQEKSIETFETKETIVIPKTNTKPIEQEPTRNTKPVHLPTSEIPTNLFKAPSDTTKQLVNFNAKHSLAHESTISYRSRKVTKQRLENGKSLSVNTKDIPSLSTKIPSILDLPHLPEKSPDSGPKTPPSLRTKTPPQPIYPPTAITSPTRQKMTPHTTAVTPTSSPTRKISHQSKDKRGTIKRQGSFTPTSSSRKRVAVPINNTSDNRGVNEFKIPMLFNVAPVDDGYYKNSPTVPIDQFKFPVCGVSPNLDDDEDNDKEFQKPPNLILSPTRILSPTKLERIISPKRTPPKFFEFPEPSFSPTRNISKTTRSIFEQNIVGSPGSATSVIVQLGWLCREAADGKLHQY